VVLGILDTVMGLHVDEDREEEDLDPGSRYGSSGPRSCRSTVRPA